MLIWAVFRLKFNQEGTTLASLCWVLQQGAPKSGTARPRLLDHKWTDILTDSQHTRSCRRQVHYITIIPI